MTKHYISQAIRFTKQSPTISKLFAITLSISEDLKKQKKQVNNIPEKHSSSMKLGVHICNHYTQGGFELSQLWFESMCSLN